ncbi:MAG: hypothetical protein OXU79_19860 [Gemmatimonadota bacterium]|nr:hypothetical protein [Gemmatimonadota bacterium]
MLFRVRAKNRLVSRIEGRQLRDFRISEHDFQSILFDNIERFLPDEELLTIAHSRNWQEEPDILALDRKGRLFIFELKVWESQSENILQALRYGQIFGQYRYEKLNELFAAFDGRKRSLDEVHGRIFEDDPPLQKELFNNEQVFVIVTNGLDFRTREAVRYWRSRGLDVRPWVYRTYADPKPDSDDSFLLEMSRFSTIDNPYEDVASKYFILNTNHRNNPKDHDDMLRLQKAAAYFSPWKRKIDQLSPGDMVFLYQSGVGIVACGDASGSREKAPYQGKAEYADEEYFMTLNRFRLVEPPLSAAQIKAISGRNYSFRGTMFSIDEESATGLRNVINQR